MGRTERPPIDTHTARIQNGGIRNLQAKRFTMEEGGDMNFKDSNIVTDGAVISFTGGSFTANTLAVANGTTFNGPVAVNSGINVAAGAFTVNTPMSFNVGSSITTNSSVTSTFNGPLDINNSVNLDGVTNLNGTVNMTNNTINMSNTSTTFIGIENEFTGGPVEFNNSGVTFVNSPTFNNNVFISGAVNTNNLYFSGSMTGDNVTVNTMRTTDVEFFGVMTGANLFINGSIVSNGITVGDPTNTGSFAGLVLQNITGTTSTEFRIKRPRGVETDSLVYTSGLGGGTTGNGLSIYNGSGGRTFFLDNETGEVILDTPINIGKGNTGANGLGVLLGNQNILINCNNPIIIGGYGNTGSGVTQDLNICGNRNSVTGASVSGINVFGVNNNISRLSGFSLVGNNNNISSVNGSISKSIIYGSDNTIASPSDSTYVVVGDNNNISMTGPVYILGSGFTNADINGLAPAGISKNTVCLGSKFSSDPCKIVIANGLSTLQVSISPPGTEGDASLAFGDAGKPIYSQLANVKIVTSKIDTAPSYGSGGNALYTLIQDSSSRRYKRNIHHTSPEFIRDFMKLKPSSYSRAGNYEYGLIAEEVAEIPEYKPFVGVDAEGKIDSIEYDRMVVLCIAKIQDQQRTINDLNKRLSDLEKKLAGLFS